MSDSPRRLHAVATLWGEAHVERWARASRRTLASPGNLPALAKAGHATSLHLFTDRASAALLAERAAPLGAHAEIRVHAFEDTPFDGSTLAARVQGLGDARMKNRLNVDTVGWTIDCALQDGANAAVLALDNDFLLADGALADAVATLDRGPRAVMVPTLRLAQERTGWTAQEGVPESGLSVADLCGRLPDALHPVSRALDVDGAEFSSYPASMLWRAGDAGWLCRSFLPHPLAFVPNPARRRSASTVDYCFALQMHPEPGALVLPAAGDRVRVFKLTPERAHDGGGSGRALDDARLLTFLYFFTNRAHRALALQPVWLPARGGDGGDARREAEARSQAMLERWFAMVDRQSAKLPLGAHAELWQRSHYGSIDEFLCPSRLSEAMRRDPSLAQLLARLGLKLGSAAVSR